MVVAAGVVVPARLRRERPIPVPSTLGDREHSSDSKNREKDVTKTFASLLTIAALTTLLLTGCGGVPGDGGSYATATELKDAFVKAGGKCDNWDPNNKSPIASTSRACGGVYALSNFDNDAIRAQMVARVEQVGGAPARSKNEHRRAPCPPFCERTCIRFRGSCGVVNP